LPQSVHSGGSISSGNDSTHSPAISHDSPPVAHDGRLRQGFSLDGGAAGFALHGIKASMGEGQMGEGGRCHEQHPNLDSASPLMHQAQHSLPPLCGEPLTIRHAHSCIQDASRGVPSILQLKKIHRRDCHVPWRPLGASKDR
jgi:hypothetical protein